MLASLDVASLAIGASLPPLIWAAFKAFAALQSAVRPDLSPHNYKVVITGSSRGLGYALADRFLALGDDVVVSSRSAEACAAAAERLAAAHPQRRVRHFTGDVRDAGRAVTVPLACLAGSMEALASFAVRELGGLTLTLTPYSRPGGDCAAGLAGSMEALASFAVKELGGLDVWVNNAGASQAPKAALADSEPAVLQAIVDTNLTGSIFGARAALRAMGEQSTSGRVFLVDGTGAWGNATPGNVAYGATKRALTQLRASLVSETRGTGATVHMVSPGMVATDLLLAGPHSESAKRILNVLAEDASTVAAWLAPRMRGVTGSGKYLKYLTTRGVLWRFLTAGRRRGRFLPEARAAKAASASAPGVKSD